MEVEEDECHRRLQEEVSSEEEALHLDDRVVKEVPERLLLLLFLCHDLDHLMSENWDRSSHNRRMQKFLFLCRRVLFLRRRRGRCPLHWYVQRKSASS